jgi:branched-subunit amino acid aminotransferase/4-amino-4-deoxychorismate lyase
MSAQGAIFHRDSPGFGLIETFRWQAPSGFFLLTAHLERLARSAAAFGIPLDPAALRARLASFEPEDESGTRLSLARVRLVLDGGGAITLSAAPLVLPGTETLWRVAIAPARFDPADPMLAYKTTRRARYEDPLARATAAMAADEVIFLNQRGEICEGARTNVFVAGRDRLLTPPLASGLLPGTLRAALLAEGRAEERVLTLDDLRVCPAWYLGNSVRGLVRARLIDHAPAPEQRA